MTGDTTSLVPGYPIRTSSDPRSVDNSPRHIAAAHVLHRPLMPRHPPCALTHLHTKNTRQKNQPNTTPSQPICLDARNHYPTLKHHTPPPRRGDTTPQRRAVSKPNSVSDDLLADPTPQRGVPRPACLSCTQPAPLQQRAPSRLDAGPMPTPSRGAP